MKNNQFIKSTLILIIGGFVTKILGFVIRVIFTRMAGKNAINLYTLITPTYSLIVAIAASFLPISLSKLISENKKNNEKLIFNSLILIIILDSIIITLALLFSKTIAFKLLREKRTLKLLYGMIFTIPFISLSSIFKGYYLGKQKMHPNVISNIIEQIIRLTLIIAFMPHISNSNIENPVLFLITLSIITESVSCLVFLSFLPRKTIINKKNLRLSSSYIKDILKLSLPLTLGRLIGNIGFFLEPILLTNILLCKGFSQEYIISNYGIYNAYAISLLTMPNFFIMAISSSILPEISKYYSQKKYKLAQKRFKQAIYLSLVLGIFFSVMILLFREELLLILYKTTDGSNFLKILSPIFVLFYLEGPLTSTLQAMGLANKSFKISTIGIIIKLISISLLAFLKFGIYSLIIAEIINIFIVVILSAVKVKKELF
jgi:stage V sporulation protein B